MRSHVRAGSPAFRGGVTLAGFFVLGSLIGWLYLQATQARVSVPDEGTASVFPGWVDPMSIFDSERPLLSPGSIVTLEAAVSAAGRPIYLPSGLPDEAAVEAEVWFSEPTRDVGLRYGAELAIVETEWQPGAIPSEVYATRAEETKVGQATTIGGHDAFVIRPDEQAPGFPPFSVVLLSIDGTEVAMYGNMPIDELVTIAESVKPFSL